MEQTFAHAVSIPEGVVTTKKWGTGYGALRVAAPQSRVFALLVAGLHHPTGTVNAGMILPIFFLLRLVLSSFQIFQIFQKIYQVCISLRGAAFSRSSPPLAKEANPPPGLPAAYCWRLPAVLRTALLSTCGTLDGAYALYESLFGSNGCRQHIDLVEIDRVLLHHLIGDSSVKDPNDTVRAGRDRPHRGGTPAIGGSAIDHKHGVHTPALEIRKPWNQDFIGEHSIPTSDRRVKVLSARGEHKLGRLLNSPKRFEVFALHGLRADKGRGHSRCALGAGVTSLPGSEGRDTGVALGDAVIDNTVSVLVILVLDAIGVLVEQRVRARGRTARKGPSRLGPDSKALGKVTIAEIGSKRRELLDARSAVA